MAQPPRNVLFPGIFKIYLYIFPVYFRIPTKIQNILVCFELCVRHTKHVCLTRCLTATMSVVDSPSVAFGKVFIQKWNLLDNFGHYLMLIVTVASRISSSFAGKNFVHFESISFTYHRCQCNCMRRNRLTKVQSSLRSMTWSQSDNIQAE